jgi:hypothetical protein
MCGRKVRVGSSRHPRRPLAISLSLSRRLFLSRLSVTLGPAAKHHVDPSTQTALLDPACAVAHSLLERVDKGLDGRENHTGGLQKALRKAGAVGKQQRTAGHEPVCPTARSTRFRNGCQPPPLSFSYSTPCECHARSRGWTRTNTLARRWSCAPKAARDTGWCCRATTVWGRRVDARDVFIAGPCRLTRAVALSTSPYPGGCQRPSCVEARRTLLDTCTRGPVAPTALLSRLLLPLATCAACLQLHVLGQRAVESGWSRGGEGNVEVGWVWGRDERETHLRWYGWTIWSFFARGAPPASPPPTQHHPPHVGPVPLGRRG